MKRATLLLLLLCLALAVPAMARDGAPRPALELQRSVSKEFVGQGSSVTLFYRVENTGNVPLTQIGITDPLCGMIGSLDELAPGEYHAFQVNVAVTQQCESAPAAVWHYGDMRYERELEAVVIAPAQNRLKVALATDRSEALSGEIVHLTAYLLNDGNTDLQEITLTDAVLGDLGTVMQKIGPGETAKWEFEVRMSQTAAYCISVCAKTESDETVTAVSNEAIVALAADPGQAQLRIFVSAAPEESPQGAALVDITLENGGDTAIADVAIMERNRGTLRTLASVASGITSFTLECPLEEQEELQFIAQFADADGSRTTVLSAPIVLQPGAAEPQALLQGGPVQLGSSAYAVFMYTGISLLALLMGVFALKWAGKRRKKRIAREKRARHMRLLRKNARMSEAEWVQTRPHKPVSLPPEKKKQN